MNELKKLVINIAKGPTKIVLNFRMQSTSKFKASKNMLSRKIVHLAKKWTKNIFRLMKMIFDIKNPQFKVPDDMLI